jgi:hypothetical protein
VIRVATAGAVGLLLLGAGCGGGGDGGGGDGVSVGSALTIDFVEQNSSGESGTVELTPNGNQTDILISTGGLAAGVPNPAGIYKGTCGNVSGKPAFELPTLEEGLSALTVDISLNDLLAGGYVIDIQKSAKDDTSIACAELKRPPE